MATVLSIIAISLSGLTLLWTIGWSIYTHRHATTPSLSVEGGYGMPAYDTPGGGSRLGDQALDVTVRNDGPVRVTVTGVHFEIEGRTETMVVPRWLFESPRPLPIVLEPGEQWHAMLPLEGAANDLREQYGTVPRIRPVAVAAGRRYPAQTPWQEPA
jgi:hypothetical protein